MPNQPPLNPDGIEAAAKSLDVNYNPERWPVIASMMRDYAEAAVSAYLAVAQPIVNSEPDCSAYRKAPWPVRERPEVKP